MELDRMDKGATGPLKNLRKHATFLIRDSLKIARLALVDVSDAELMTEEATNTEDWGPPTKTMAAISDAAYNYEEFLRIVRVLRKRLSLSGKKYWRQVQKSLTLLEYLLTHGPEHLVMEFREDKNRIEEFTRFVYVDENEIDRGSVLQRKAKHVLQLLMDEGIYREERTRAQKISKGISGFGSQTTWYKSARSESSDEGLSNIVASRLPKVDQGEDSTSLLINEDGHSNSRAIFKKYLTYPGLYIVKSSNVSNQSSVTAPDGETLSPISYNTSDSSWGAFSTSSAGDSPNASSLTASTSSDVNFSGESPTSFENLTTPLSPSSSGRRNLLRPISPLQKASKVLDMGGVESELTAIVENAPSETPTLLKLPPPPSMAGYRCVTPRPPPVGSRERRPEPRNSDTMQSINFIDI